MRGLKRITIVAAVLVGVACIRGRSVPEVKVGPVAALVGPGGVLMHPVGIETLGGVFTPLMQAGCATPCSIAETFTTGSDNQDQITIRVYHGTQATARQNELVGAFQVFSIPPALRGKPQVTVRFVVTPRAEVLLTASDGSGGALPVRLEPAGQAQSAGA